MRRGRVVLLALGSCLYGCESSPTASNTAPTRPDPGLVFTYPRDGQNDVPLDSPIVVTWSDETQAAARVRLEGSAGDVVTSMRSQGKTQVLDAVLAPHSTYRLVVGDVVRATFHTATRTPLQQTPPTVLTVNEAPVGEGLFLDVGTLRLVFSEPLDPATVNAKSVQLVDANGAAVLGSVIAQGAHVTFDPLDRLPAQSRPYQLRLGAEIQDLGGEALSPVVVDIAPHATQQGHEQTLTLDPTASGATSPPLSPLAALNVNSTVLASQLLGSNALHIGKGSLKAVLWDPADHGGAIPFTMPRGQRIDVGSLDIKLGGQVSQGVSTGTLHFTLLSDAFGVLTRSPYRASDQLPDDERAPIFVDVVMDAVVTSEDVQGHVLATQNILGIRLLGTATTVDDYLIIDLIGAFDYDTLGIGFAKNHLALRLRSGLDGQGVSELAAPRIVSSYPAPGARDFEADHVLQVNYTAPLDPASLGQISLTQGGAPVPIDTWLNGSVVLIKPARRLEDATAGVLHLDGVKSLSGAAIGGTAIEFSTADLSVDTVDAPPLLLGLVPGAPCALTGTSSDSPGACAGGQATDSSYQAFRHPANHQIRAWFSQPMDPATMVLGQACGTGSVRIEREDASGRCTGVVPGTLFVKDRGLHFVPNAAFEVDGAYRITLVAGMDGTCEAGELCSRARKPLNTDPMSGMDANAGGGPDVVVRFVATAATADNFQPLESSPHADQNGNGYLDSQEVLSPENRVAYEVAGVGGVITEASLNGDDCMPEREGKQVCVSVHAALPVDIQQVLSNCPIDLQGEPASGSTPCVQTHLFPTSLLFSSLSMNTTALGILPVEDLAVGQVFVRILEPKGPAYGYILPEPGSGVPQYVIHNDVYIDAPDLKILDGFVTHDLHSKPLRTTLKGPVTFRPDGRMNVALRSAKDLTITVNVDVLGLPGHVELRIPAGAMAITLGGPMLR